MTRMVLGVVGHVDHGKTALVRALTGIDTDRLAEEKVRGISISLGFAHLAGPGGLVIDLIDMPGHERFVRTMIGGAMGLDAILIVVAANEGVMPQTVEHVAIAGLLGVARVVVAVSKLDLAEEHTALEAGHAAARLAQRAGMTVGPPVLTSAARGLGLEALRDALFAAGRGLPARSVGGLAYLPIDRAFGVVGHGPVVTGTLRGAPVCEGDVLELTPRTQRVRIKALQVNGRRVDRVEPGQRVALNLRDIPIGEIKRGMSLAAPGALAKSRWATITIRALDNSPPLRNGMRLRTLFGTSESDALVRLLDRDELRSGEAGFAQLHFPGDVMVPSGEHVLLRRTSPASTVAGGRVLEPVTWRLRRNQPHVLARLQDLAELAAPELLSAELARAGMAGVSLLGLSRLVGLSPASLRRVLKDTPVVEVGPHLVLQDALSLLVDRVRHLLAESPAPLSRDSLISALPKATGPILDQALAILLKDRIVVRKGAGFGLYRPDEERELAREQDALAGRVAEHLRAGGLTPDLPEDIRNAVIGTQILNRLVRRGVLVRTNASAKQKAVLFHADAVELAKQRMTQMLTGCEQGLRVGEIGPALGMTRKYSVPLLAYLDDIRFTRRVGDRRVLYRSAEAPDAFDTCDRA